MTRPDVGTEPIEDSTPVMFHCCPIDSRVGRCQNHHLIHHNPHHMFACQSQCCPKIALNGRCHILPVYPPLANRQKPASDIGEGPKSVQLLPGFKGPSPPLSLHDPGISARVRESQRSSLKRERIPRRGGGSPGHDGYLSAHISGTCPEAQKIPAFLHEPN